MKTDFDIHRLVRSNVANLAPYSSARDEFTESTSDMVFLDANENPFDTGVNRYPDPQQIALKKVLASQRNIKPSQLLLGNGSDEVLDLLFRAFCEPTIDNVITSPPTYGMYEVLANINAIENRKVICTVFHQLDVATILQKINAYTKMILVCSPNNPTGNVLNEKDITKLLTKYRGLLVIDEAYIDFSETESWVSQLEKYPNLVITQTLSKAYGMAGIRLGMCMASEAIIAVLNKIKPPYNINQLTQEKALQLLSEKELTLNHIQLILKEKEILYKVLLDVKFVKKVYPSQANFLLVKVDNATKRYEQLIDKGIVVRNRSNQPLCFNCLRFTIGTPQENNVLIETLQSL